MNDQEINIAIAEACGWASVFKHGFPGLVTGVPPKGYPIHRDPFPTDCGPTIYELPRYSTDLNAMHEAEKTFSDTTFGKYCEILAVDVIGWDCYEREYLAVRATARQRAEAFLKTIGKWKEGE